jgi:hypothetical protein
VQKIITKGGVETSTSHPSSFRFSNPCMYMSIQYCSIDSIVLRPTATVWASPSLTFLQKDEWNNAALCKQVSGLRCIVKRGKNGVTALSVERCR